MVPEFLSLFANAGNNSTFLPGSGPENPVVPVLFGGHTLPPLVEIGLTDLQKTGVREYRPENLIHTFNADYKEKSIYQLKFVVLHLGS